MTLPESLVSMLNMMKTSAAMLPVGVSIYVYWNPRRQLMRAVALMAFDATEHRPGRDTTVPRKEDCGKVQYLPS